MNQATAKLIATFFYAGGLLKPAPGTWGGSLAALPAAWALHMIAGPLALTIATIVAYMAGLYATRAYTAGSDNHDPPGEVVIDEVVGMWIALMPVSFGARMMGGVDILALYPGWIVAFLAFRLFDITKPGPIGAADRRGDAAGGVMLDDVYAGFAAAFTVIVLAYASHGLMGGADMDTAALLDLCRAKGLRIATAESCTGGMVGALLTEVPGSSDVVECGFITYSNAAKVEMLGVGMDALAAHGGAVSEEVAAQMARGAVTRSLADIAVSITGIAGPPGGSEHKPEGRVCFAIARGGDWLRAETIEFGAQGRTKVREAAAQHALALLKEAAEL